MQVFTIFANNRLRNNQYIIRTHENKAICIDPFDGEQVSLFLQENNLSAHILLNTHEHYDHKRGNPQILALGAKFVDNKELTAHPLCISCDLDSRFEMRSLPTAGHTMDSYSYLIFETQTLTNTKASTCRYAFLGDTLFHLGAGNCYNGGDSRTLAHTLLSLDTILEDETILYLGHDYFESNYQFSKKNFELPASFVAQPDNQSQYMSWGAQKAMNPFLRVLFDEIFRKKYYADHDAVEAFMNMRDLRDKF